MITLLLAFLSLAANASPANCELKPYDLQTACEYDSVNIYYYHLIYSRVCKPEFQNGDLPLDLLEDCAAAYPDQDGKLSGACDEFYDYKRVVTKEVVKIKDLAGLANLPCRQI